MKNSKRVYNATDSEITVVTGIETVIIPSESFANVTIPEGAVFNHPDGSFYIEEDGNYYAKFDNCESGAYVEIYLEK